MEFLDQENFTTDDFINNHYSTLSEKEVDGARSELTQLNEYCKQEVSSCGSEPASNAVCALPGSSQWLCLLPKGCTAATVAMCAACSGSKGSPRAPQAVPGC